MEDPLLTDGLNHLREVDEDFARALGMIAPLPSRQRDMGFEALTRIIIEQQVSLASAAAIWGRVQDDIAPFTPTEFLKRSEDRLRELGLSRPKARYCLALAGDISEGRLDLDRLPDLSDKEAAEHLTQVKGIGRWTAEIYLISCLQRPDIWPAGDVALQIALQHLKSLETRPTIDEMDDICAHLSPHRTLAARVLWRYYVDVVKPPKNSKPVQTPA